MPAGDPTCFPNYNYTYGAITTVGATGPTGATYSVPWNITTNSANNVFTTTAANSYPSIKVDGDAEFSGNIRWGGRDLGKLLLTIETRLAIISNPDPKKLEKFAALKKAYEHYKTLEKLLEEE